MRSIAMLPRVVQDDHPRKEITSSMDGGLSGEYCESDDVVLLQPFSHQVGGHCSLLMLGERTVCKPYTKREHQFYQNVHAKLTPFIPEFRGIIEVYAEEDNNGYLIMSASPPVLVVQDKSSPTKRRIRRSTRMKFKRSSTEMDRSEHPTVLFQYSSKTYCQNPWAKQCQALQLAKMRLLRSQKHRFLLLENLAYCYQYPSVLDLKMGTRHYGDDASEHKRRRQKAKSLESTSSTIAVRLGGMQVFDQRTKTYTCYDKYYGRSLSVRRFKETIVEFFNNGISIRTDLITSLKGRLEELNRVLNDSPGYRFYSSSLLIIYEGDACANQSPFIDVRMIDFGHSTCQNFEEDPQHVGPDKGYLQGVNSLIQIMHHILAEMSSGVAECGELGDIRHC
uniref:Kinase n=1 Tax=Trichuris muris TaxID=70415 RepID=A0A5S6QAH8_TRIMR